MQYLIASIVLFAPLYTWRFELLNFRANFLMLWVIFVLILFIIYLINQKLLQNFFLQTKNINKKILILTSLFFLSGVLSLFVNGIDIKKIGQFLVLFIQPISLFFIGNYIFKQSPKTKSYLLLTTYYLLAIMGLFAITQYFTLWGLPQQFWGNNVEPKRAISFFPHPNFYALFSAPLLAFLVPDVVENFKFKILNLKLISWTLGVCGLFFSLSRAGWFGLFCAILIYLIFVAEKKVRKLASVIVIVLVIVLFSVPNFRYRLLLPFYGEKSAVSRISLWSTGVKAIKESPVFGLGLNGFSNNWNKLNTNPNLDTHNFPHNIFLSLWAETGLLGLISFIGIAWVGISRGLLPMGVILRSASDEGSQKKTLFRQPEYKHDATKLGIALFLICLLTQGLIDNPYFKNDLALVFWIVLALI